jgi:hypothetical protein
VKIYHAAVIGAALALTMAACGGGGSGTSAPGGPGPNPSPAGSFRPAKNGDTFHYAGTLEQTFWRPAQPGPSNAPSPEPTSTTNWTVDTLTSVTTNTTFHGLTGLTTFAEDEIDTGLPTIETVTNDYFLFPAGGTGPLLEDGFRSLDSNFVLTDVLRDTGSNVVDMLPEAPQATWTNAARLASVETDPDSQTSTRLVNADGSYTETDAFPDGTFSSAIANADGSGSYAVLKGTPFETDYAYAAPAGGTIVITATEPAASPQPSPVVFTVPNWQPAGGLASDAYVDNGIVQIPSSCALPAGFGTQGYDIAELRTAVDPVFGAIENVTEHSYVVQGRGVACVARHDSVTGYYDFSGQNGIAFFSGLPIQYTIVDETVSLRGETILASGTHRPSLLVPRGAIRLVNALRARQARAIHAGVLRAHGAGRGDVRARAGVRRTLPT